MLLNTYKYYHTTNDWRDRSGRVFGNQGDSETLRHSRENGVKIAVQDEVMGGKRGSSL